MRNRNDSTMMRTTLRTLLSRLTLLSALSSLLLTAAANAQAPVFDLAAALSAAQPGDTITVPAGVYAGPLRIDKPLTLQGEGEPIIDGGGQSDVVIVNAPAVTIRGFVIRNSGI